MTLILLRSPKGGVGTTFLTARLAMSLADRGHQVSAVDCTAQESLKLFFGLSPSQTLEMLDGEATPDAVAGVELFQAYPDQDAAGIAEQLLARASDDRICLVDLGTAGPKLRDQLLPHATLEICPLAPSPVSLAALTKVDTSASVLSLTRTAFVLNMMDDRRRLSNDIHNLVRTLLGEQLLGTVRRDEAVMEALAAMKPLATVAPASAALADVAKLTDAVIARCDLSPTGVLRDAAA
ncbi:cellulose synthase operon protein YhjQ/BcsQ [Sphingomonas sp. PL-96]|uniref:cellulose synthase operon protein YhjQ/BcsQ n=1 Tax=Sphingomonas sp. PL-96 TaxID=2887201 RepID=UPI001E34B847|nr:cellulose synthase operon protein YhjQ/BcsQ [Sphingomonas sp. PL-96]MCC2976776.1 cellulose synthase operon protein YhjQ/BcsQ [Sphingomonas sp. PL-96]